MPFQITSSAITEEDEEVNRREIGDEAVWSLSSAKPGNGVDQLRDSTCASVAGRHFSILH